MVYSGRAASLFNRTGIAKEVTMVSYRMLGGITGVLVALCLTTIGCENNPLEHSTQSSPVARVAPGAPDSYIVVLHETVRDIPAVANEMARTHGAAVGFTYRYALKGFSATIPASRLEKLRSDPRVKSVEPDLIATISKRPAPEPPTAEEQKVDWGIDEIDAEPIFGILPYTGAGVRVYIIDTGIDRDHPDLNVRGGVNYVQTAKSYDDDNGHGTHVAGTVAALNNTIGVVGVAPEAELYAVKVLDRRGSGAFSQIIAGVDYVTQQKVETQSVPMVANMSLGAYVGYPTYNALDTAVLNSITAGVVYTIAAGNDGADASLCSPAHVIEAITVGAYADYPAGLTFATYSNRGPVVDLNAPGSYIYSTYKGGGYTTLSGTSMAAPHVTGTVALYLSNSSNGSSPVNVQNALLATAKAMVTVGVPAGTTNLSVYAGDY